MTARGRNTVPPLATAIKWLTEPGLELPLALLRVAVGVLTLRVIADYLWQFDLFVGEHALIPRADWIVLPRRSAWSLLRIVRSDGAVYAATAAGLVPAALLTIGVWPRVAAALSWALLSSLQDRNPLILSGGDTLLRIVLFLLIFARSDRRLAPGASLRPVVPSDSWPIRLVQVQLALVYLSTAMAKLGGETWRDGSASSYALRYSALARADWSRVANHLVLNNLLTYGTLAFELAFPFLIWSRRIRPYLLITGVILHLGFDLLLDIPLFQWMMIAAYFAFWEPSWAERLVGALKLPQYDRQSDR